MIANLGGYNPRETLRQPALFFLVIWSLAPEPAVQAQETRPAQFTLREIYEGANTSRKLLKSLRVEYVYTTRLLGGAPPPKLKAGQLAIGTWRRTYAVKGERRYSVQGGDGDSEPSEVSIYVFDGDLGFSYRPGSLVVVEGKTPDADQGDYYFEEGLDIPVSDEMRANYDNSWCYPHCLRPASGREDFVLLANQEQIDGAWCHVVDCGGGQKLWVDPQIGFALRRKEMYSDGGRLADYSFSKFTEPVKGLWLPSVVRRLTNPGDDVVKPDLETLVEVTSLSVNQLTDRDFDLVVPAGTIVTGMGKAFVTQGDRTKMLDLLAGGLLQRPKSRSVWEWLIAINVAMAVVAAGIVCWRWRSKRRMSLPAGPGELAS